MNVIKVVLTPEKTVYLREPKIADIEKSSQVAGQAGGTNQTHISILMQKELLKSILVKVNDRELGLKDKSDLDTLFSLNEYMKLQKVVGKLTGDLGNEEIPMEFVSSIGQ